MSYKLFFFDRHELKSLNTWKRVCDSRQQGRKVILHSSISNIFTNYEATFRFLYQDKNKGLCLQGLFLCNNLFVRDNPNRR